MGLPSVVGHVAAQSTDGNAITTSSIDTTNATLLVAGLSYDSVGGPGSPAVSDSKSNTWVALTSSGGPGQRSQLYYVKNPVVGTGHTFTGGGTASFPAIFVVAIRDTDVLANVDQQNNNFLGSPGTTIQPGSVTPSLDGEAIVTHAGTSQTGAVLSIDSGFAILDQFPVSPGLAYGGGLAYRIQSAKTADNPTWTSTGAAEALCATIATFEPADLPYQPAYQRAPVQAQ